MAFIRRKGSFSTPTMTIGGPDRTGPLDTNTIITNSGVMKVGDIVAVTAQAAGNGHVVRRYNTAGDAIVGVCIGFGRENGAAVAFDSGTNDTVTVGATNETVAKIYAKIDITPGAQWSAPLSGAVHTTAIARAGAYTDPDTGTNAGRALETSMTVSTVQGRGLAILGLDPDGPQTGTSARVLCTIEETIFKAGIGV